MSLTTRILVTGGDGILAQALRPFFPFGTFLSRGECDVTNPNQVRAVFNEVKPEIVIHCAAQHRA
jgi:dTDP-4-dehydrorhamnose reductase